MQRIHWRVATLVERSVETPNARTLVFDVPGWPGHLPGQHVDVRLTAPDGYSTQRSYSISSASTGERVDLTVQTVADGEVSPFLTEVLDVGDQLEIRGPVGGWFVWRQERTAPVLLVAGGAGIVPHMAMIRTRRAVGSTVPFRLIYSVRAPGERYFVDEFRRRDPGLDVAFVYTRKAPDDDLRPVGRMTVADVARQGWPAELEPDCFVCGPTGFVEAAAAILLHLGHDPRRVRTERFGPSGGAR
ncbi:MAG: ferredoxin reductase [Nocardioidaceae bacterium]